MLKSNVKHKQTNTYRVVEFDEIAAVLSPVLKLKAGPGARQAGGGGRLRAGVGHRQRAGRSDLTQPLRSLCRSIINN